MKNAVKTPLSIYIHCPYCASHCPYCAFYSEIKPIENLTGFYLRDLNQLALNSNQFSVQSIYFGGGTPSLHPASFFENFITEISKIFSFQKDCEITIEINPGTLTSEQLKDYKIAGLTRPSFGIQSFDLEKLKFLGRKHSSLQSLKLIETAHKSFKTFSGDFIYGLPHQTPQEWEPEIDFIFQQKIPHLSFYSLSLEPNTPFFKKFSEKQLDDGSLYEITQEQSHHHGYLNYEVSNFAHTENDFSRHNLSYWLGHSYLGLGPSAHGRIETKPHTWMETTAPPSLSKWKKGGLNIQPISTDIRAQEIILMQLRTTFPLTEQFLTEKTGHTFKNTLDPTACKKHEALKHLVLNEKTIQTTPLGRQFLNTVLQDILIFAE